MRDYGVVSPKFWIGETGKKLRGQPEAQIVALYLMTCPHANMIGVFHCPLLYISHETGLPFEGASKGLQSLVEVGFCSYDDDAEVVFVHRMVNFQVGESIKESDNRVKAVIKEWQNIQSSVLRQAFEELHSESFHLPVKAEKRRPSKAPSKPLRSQEQEQEQEQEHPLTPSGGFDGFWAVYPKKVGKDAARKAFEKRSPNAELLAKMLAAIAVQAASEQWRKDGGQYIPNPSTWLNQGRWEDEGVSADTATGDSPKRGTDEYAAFHRSASWWRDAGFDTIWDAMANKCWHSNADEFRDGQRIKEAA